MRSSPRTVPGTGLSSLPFALLVTFSVALFLFWDGPLWLAKREASHVGRFAFSYLLVIPAAALLLFLARRFDWSHLTAATAAAWSVKLVVTSGLYFALARGTVITHVSSSTPVSSKGAAPVAPDYRPATGTFAAGAVKGDVVLRGRPVEGAVVLVDEPLPGLSLSDSPAPIHVVISGGRHEELVHAGRTDADIDVASADGALHTFHLYDLAKGAGRSPPRAISNLPVPGDGRPRRVTPPDPGIYEARCDTHPTERTRLVLVDHPYLTRSGAAGDFSIQGIASGPVTLVVVAADLAGGSQHVIVRRIPARVESSETTVVHIDLSTPEVAEERL